MISESNPPLTRAYRALKAVITPAAVPKAIPFIITAIKADPNVLRVILNTSSPKAKAVDESPNKEIVDIVVSKMAAAAVDPRPAAMENPPVKAAKAVPKTAGTAISET